MADVVPAPRGQCGSTALVIHDLLGGELLIAEVFRGDGSRQGVHCGHRVTILATGNCVAACRHALLQWPRRAARNVLCIRKEVPAMFANRQTPPRVAL